MMVRSDLSTFLIENSMTGKVRAAGICILTVILFITPIGPRPGAAAEGRALTAFVSSVSRPPLEESVALFQKETGVTVHVTYGGSGSLLSQLILGRRGDLYLPASPDFMNKALDRAVVAEDAVVKLAYIYPAILVQAGNPKGISGLPSLTLPGLRVILPNPRTVSSGVYAVELLEINSLADGVKPNIIAYSESYEKALNLLSLKAVDAVIGWRQVPRGVLGKIDVVPLKDKEIPRVAYISAAVTNYARNANEARRFLGFLTSPRVRAIFRKHGFPTTVEEIRKIAPEALIGGRYDLPEGW
jgi:molybdate transport system substrate-binding protein